MVEDIQLLTYSSCTLPGLAGVYGCRDDEGGVEIQFNLQAKRAGSSHVVKSSKDCCMQRCTKFESRYHITSNVAHYSK